MSVADRYDKLDSLVSHTKTLLELRMNNPSRKTVK